MFIIDQSQNTLQLNYCAFWASHRPFYIYRYVTRNDQQNPLEGSNMFNGTNLTLSIDLGPLTRRHFKP